MSSVSHLHLRQDIVDEAVLDEVKVDQLVLQLDDPADGRVEQLAEEKPALKMIEKQEKYGLFGMSAPCVIISL